MPSAGAVCPPVITPLRKAIPGLSGNKIDTSTLIELCTETTECKIFFTSDGTKPNPFQRKVAGREVTFKYIGSFTLKPGKRTIKAIAVARDGLRESDVMTKQFNVEDIGRLTQHLKEDTTTTDDYSGFFDTSDQDSDSTIKPKTKKKITRKTKSPVRGKSPLRKSLTKPPREAWASEPLLPDTLGSASDGPFPTQQIPDGPFNPTNYSGTQINVWGGAIPPHIPGVGPGIPPPPYPTQYGYLTENMINTCNPDGRYVTVGDIKRMTGSRKPPPEPPKPVEPPPSKPAIEYPVYQDPPLNSVSPGKGDFKDNIMHIYAHMLEYAKNTKDFRLRVAEPQMGKMLEAKFEDEGDGYKITVVMAKPGIPRGAVRKQPKIETFKKPPPAEKTKPKKKEKEKEKPPPQPKSDPFFAMETEDLQTEGTVKPYDKFNAEQDAEVLRKAMKGLGTDEEAITNVLAYRSNPQRQEIRTTFKTMFGKDLIEELKSELSGHYLDTCKSLLMAPAEYDAYQLHKAIKGLGTDEDVLIEILCTRSNAQIKMIKETYKAKYNKELEKDIIGDTSGNLKRLLVSQVQANRDESKEVDRNKAKQDAKALYEAGEKKWGTDESRFNVILVSRSYPQLRATFDEYDKLSKKDFEEVLKSEMSGDLLSGMKTIVRCVRNKAGHFARQLQKTMKGIGTDDDTLVRVVVSRCEIDMVQIKEAFESLAGQTLQQYIADDLSSDYRDVILSLVMGGPPPDRATKSGKGFVEAVKYKTEEELDEQVRMETENIQEDPTLKPAENFNAENDAEVLKKAMKGFGTDEKAIINVLGFRSNEQRMEIVKTFKTMFGKDLVKELDGELSGGLKVLCHGLCMTSPDFDAMNLNKAIKGLGTDEQVLVEIICTRSNAQIQAFKTAYKAKYGKELETDVAGDTSGNFKRLLISCLQANRDESKEFDRNKAKQDAQALHEAGEKKWGTDESRFNVILVARSYAQLRATFQEYAKLANKDIEDTLKSEMSGDLLKGMLAVVRCIRSKPAHFGDELYKSMKGLGTDDDRLCRILVSRCEVDMVQIKEAFQQAYKQTLGMFIADDVSGDYKALSLALIGEGSTTGKDTTEKKSKKGWF
ncbi:annexin A6-like [Pecten maximus]|uniref:annexin A6-like n=1 Tax=Pecten maximus TaxID=6579 RepID=UPI0014590A79|nr:annexin A6-like [Pecten maximus]